jgi:hypothetical protein
VTARLLLYPAPYLWRAADQDGEVVDVYLQAKRDGAAAKRFFKRFLGAHAADFYDLRELIWQNQTGPIPPAPTNQAATGLGGD